MGSTIVNTGIVVATVDDPVDGSVDETVDEVLVEVLDEVPDEPVDEPVVGRVDTDGGVVEASEASSPQAASINPMTTTDDRANVCMAHLHRHRTPNPTAGKGPMVTTLRAATTGRGSW